jgi:ABC-type amino acid transport substrate-binding protein
MAIAKHSLFVMDGDTWNYTDLSSLDDRKIGAISGYSYGYLKENYLDSNMGNNVTLVFGDKPLAQLVNLLKVGRVDTIAAEEKVLRLFLKNNGAELKVRNAGVAYTEEVFVGFNANLKGAAYILEKINSFPTQERAEEIFELYVGEDKPGS